MDTHARRGGRDICLIGNYFRGRNYWVSESVAFLSFSPKTLLTFSRINQYDLIVIKWLFHVLLPSKDLELWFFLLLNKLLFYGKLESTVQLVILTLVSLTFLGGRSAAISCQNLQWLFRKANNFSPIYPDTILIISRYLHPRRPSATTF